MALPLPEMFEGSVDETARRAARIGTPADPAFHGNGRYGAPPNPPADYAPKQLKQPGMGRRIADGLRSAVPTVESATAAGRVVGRAAAAAKPILRVGGAAGVTENFNDYKLKADETDSSAKGTWNALRQGDIGGAKASAGKGALETAMDLGSAAASTADYFVPGKQPISRAYNSMLRETFGNQLVDNSGVRGSQAGGGRGLINPPMAMPPTTASGAAPGVSTPGVTAPGGAAPPAIAANPTDQRLAAGTLRAPQSAPQMDRPDQRVSQGNVLNTDAGYQADLKELSRLRDPNSAGAFIGSQYVATPESQLAAQRQSVSVGDGGSTLGQGPIGFNPNYRAEVDAKNEASTRSNMLNRLESASRLATRSSERRAAMAAYAQLAGADDRNGAERIAGLRERGETARAGAQNNQALRIAELNNATQRRNNDQNNATTLRGQDVDYEVKSMPTRLLDQQRRLHSQVYGSVGAGEGTPNAGHHLKAADAFDRMGAKEQAAEARAAAAAMQTVQSNQDTQAATRAADTEKVFAPMFTRKVKDAQGNEKEEFDNVAAAKAAATVRGIYGEKFDQLSPQQKRSAYTEIAAKQKNMEAERQVMPSIGNAALDLVGLYDKPAEVSTPRTLRGGTVERAGLISRPGVDRNSTLMRLPNGQTINYGVADAAQLEDIQRRLRP